MRVPLSSRANGREVAAELIGLTMPKPVHINEVDLTDAENTVDSLLDSNVGARNIFRGMIIVRMAVVLEDNILEHGDLELNAIRELRNAILHNNFDTSKNWIDAKKKSPGLAESIIRDYLTELKNGNIPSAPGNPEPLRPYFSMDGSIVRLDQGAVSEPCRQILMKRLRISDD